MRRCDNTDELCYDEDGGGGDYPYWDFCEYRGWEMPDEVVLIVTGVPEGISPPPRGIWLRHMSLSQQSAAPYFVFQRE